MGALIRAHDWASTLLGPPRGWPQSLRSMVALLLSANHPMFIWWGPELVQFYNDAYRQTMGPERHPSALGQRGRECWAEIWPIIGPQVEHVMAGGQVWCEDALVPVTRHGRLEQVWWTYSYSPISDERGAVGGVLVICSDVTERHRVTDALRESQERLRFALEAGGGVGTWDWDVRADRVYADERFATLFSIDPAAARQGAPVSDFFSAIHAADRPEVERRIAVALASAGDFSAEYRVATRDGRQRWLLARGRCYHDAQGRPLRFPGVAVDTTEQHRVIDALRQADQRKDEFLAMLGHELRNPLSPILTAAALLKQADAIGPAGVARARDVIERQARHLSGLVDELLDVARINSGKINLKRESVAIADAVHRAVEQSGELIAKHRHRLTVAVPPQPLYVNGDLGRLTQVLGNLLHNAAKYTEPGGEIDVLVDVMGEVLRVRVRDNGIGIGPDVLPHVFDLFLQASPALDRAQGGLGVGLTLVRRLVEMHGGRAGASSKGVGHGSEFTILLPLAPVTTPDPATVPVALPGVQPRRVMVVDDNRDAAEMLASVLGMQGHSVTLAYTGLEALEQVVAYSPQIMLLDLGLPGMSGFEVARALRGMELGIPPVLVAVTGYGQEEDRVRSKAHGFDHHLTKPVDMEELARLLAALPS